MVDLERERIRTRRRINIASIIFGLLILPWPFFAIISGMAISAPGAGDNLLTLQLIYAVWTYPLVVVVSVAAAWIFYRRKNFLYARRAALLPLANFAYFFLMVILLGVVCGGQFACK